MHALLSTDITCDNAEAIMRQLERGQPSAPRGCWFSFRDFVCPCNS